jgi:hypothetical protein
VRQRDARLRQCCVSAGRLLRWLLLSFGIFIWPYPAGMTACDCPIGGMQAGHLAVAAGRCARTRRAPAPPRSSRHRCCCDDRNAVPSHPRSSPGKRGSEMIALIALTVQPLMSSPCCAVRMRWRRSVRIGVFPPTLDLQPRALCSSAASSQQQVKDSGSSKNERSHSHTGLPGGPAGGGQLQVGGGAVLCDAGAARALGAVAAPALPLTQLRLPRRPAGPPPPPPDCSAASPRPRSSNRWARVVWRAVG